MDAKSLADIKFIQEFRNLCLQQNWRLVVYGGYGVDIFVGRITRKHNDIDLVIYGQNSRSQAQNSITDMLNVLIIDPVITIKQNQFQLEVDVVSPKVGLNLYYVQTAMDPFKDLNQVVQSNGEIFINDPGIFPPPQKGSIDGISFEVQDQKAHIEDILKKNGSNQSKYIHDISLLSPLLG